MNPKQKAVSAALRALLESSPGLTDRSEAAPSLQFTAAAARPIDGPTAAEVHDAVRRLEEAEHANDSGPLARALLAVTQALV